MTPPILRKGIILGIADLKVLKDLAKVSFEVDKTL